jgi:hypothetical protein
MIFLGLLEFSLLSSSRKEGAWGAFFLLTDWTWAIVIYAVWKLNKFVQANVIFAGSKKQMDDKYSVYLLFTPARLVIN